MNNEQLDFAPCGFLTLTEEGNIVYINDTLQSLLGYSHDSLISENINKILTLPSQIFYQLYFVPLVKVKQVEEMYLSLESIHKEEVPVLVNAKQRKKDGKVFIDCVLIKMQKRNEFENELLEAKKVAESALEEKAQANADLQQALLTLEKKQEELLILYKQNQQYKLETEKELQLAKLVQKTSLTKPLHTEHLQTEAYYQPSNQLSGDMYGFYQVNEHTYGIMIVDVMGHGISSSLITMSLHSLFQKLISAGSKADIVMKELDQHLHTLFQHNEEARHYSTAIYMLIDTKKQEISYINAGHPGAVWQPLNGEQVELSSTIPPIGLIKGIQFETSIFTYTSPGRLFLYTDGVSDIIESNTLLSIIKAEKQTSLIEMKKKLISLINKELPETDKNDDKCFIIIDLNEKLLT